MAESISSIDDQLSRRFIALDPSGYFLIRLEASAGELVVEHYTNDLDANGRAVDPDTGELLGCHGGRERLPVGIYRGKSAKQVGIQITEGPGPHPLSRLDHAMYLGRELQRAEACLVNGEIYIQD